MFVSSFKSLVANTALAAATITAGFVTTPPAHATDCVYGEGYQLCFVYQHKNKYGEDVFSVRLRNNHTTEQMDVVCDGSRMVTWRSRGGASQSEANYLARFFCSHNS